MTVQVPVLDLYVHCALQVRNHASPGVAMSDCCQAPATAAAIVRHARGELLSWRCTEHRCVVRQDSRGKQVLGEYVTSVPRDKHPAE